jgi:hypothetical protein
MFIALVRLARIETIIFQDVCTIHDIYIPPNACSRAICKITDEGTIPCPVAEGK